MVDDVSLLILPSKKGVVTTKINTVTTDADPVTRVIQVAITISIIVDVIAAVVLPQHIPTRLPRGQSFGVDDIRTIITIDKVILPIRSQENHR